MTITSPHIFEIALWISLASGFSAWDWAEIAAAIMVSVGCIGEMFWLFREGPPKSDDPHHEAFENKKTKMERLFAIVVAVGVTVEVIALPRNLKEAADLRKEVESLKITNSVVGKQLVDAKTKLANLEISNLPMDLGEQSSLGKDLEVMPGIEVRLREAFDSKAQQTADSLMTVFAFAKWQVENRGFARDMKKDGIAIGCKPSSYDLPNSRSEQAAILLRKLLTARRVPCQILPGFEVADLPENTIIVAVFQRPPQLESEVMLLDARRKELDLQERKIVRRLTIFEGLHNTNALPKDAALEFGQLNAQLVETRKEIESNTAQKQEKWGEIGVLRYGTNKPAVGFRDWHIGDPPVLK